MPASTRSSVLFPTPFDPTRPTDSPGEMRNETSREQQFAARVGVGEMGDDDVGHETMLARGLGVRCCGCVRLRSRDRYGLRVSRRVRPRVRAPSAPGPLGLGARAAENSAAVSGSM